MSRFRPHPGTRIPLFDRLVDDNPGEGAEVRPLRFLDAEGLRQSLARDVSRLFNTQVPVAATDPSSPRPAATVLDYGIADLVSRSLMSSEARQLLCSDLTRAMRAFEPRLTDPQVTIAGYDQVARRLTVTVSGILAVGQVGEALSFPVELHSLRRE